jgi:hypothetical protein
MNVPAVGQHLVIVGASGMVGGYALRYALDQPAIQCVTAIGRKKLGISHPKLTVALEKATAACKEEAKVMKLSWHWLKHRKYVKNCIIRTAVQADPSVDIQQIRRAVDMKSLRPQRPGEWGCDPMC